MPATVAIVDGRIQVGLSDDALVRVAREDREQTYGRSLDANVALVLKQDGPGCGDSGLPLK